MNTKALSSIADIVECQLTTFPIWKDQKVSRSERTDGHTAIHLYADRFYDRIAGNGWTYAISTTIVLTPKGVIYNVTDNSNEVLPRLAAILGEMAVTAYKDRTNWYWTRLKAMPSPVVPEKYRQLQGDYTELIESAII